VPGEGALLSGLKLVSAALTVGLVPGVLCLLASGLATQVSLLETAALGIALSLAIAQGFTMVILLLHVPVGGAAMTLAAGCVGGGLLVTWRARRAPGGVPVGREELALGGLILLLSALLYVRGSPVMSGEDRIHAGVIRRLGLLPRPALDNFYVAAGVVYPHPFPGAHVLVAMIGRLADLDALFVYRKLRFFWGPAALLLVYAGARVVFRRRDLAFVSGATAVVLVAVGAFSEVPKFFWAQLAPYSHVGDLAMNVFLPALLVVLFHFVTGTGRRAVLFFGCATLALIVTVTMVHIREIVQVVVYLGSFTVALAALRADRAVLARAAGLFVVTVGLVEGYVTFHRRLVDYVGPALAPATERLGRLAAEMSLWDWVASPLNDSTFSIGLRTLFSGPNGLLLLLCPLVLLAFRTGALTIFFAASMAGYALIIRFPALTIPYLQLTYVEMFFAPVRNVIFFLYVLAGPLLYLGANAIARLRRRWVAAGALALTCLVLWRVWKYGGRVLERYQGLFLLIVVLLCVIALAAHRSAAVQRLAGRLLPTAPRAGWVIAWLVLLTVTAVRLAVPASSPFVLPLRVLLTPEAVLLDFPCIPQGTPGPEAGPGSCPPSPGLVRWAGRHLPISAVMANNTLNRYAPPSFMPQRIVAWPTADTSASVVGHAVYPEYYRFLDASMATYGAQPLFNARESLAERRRFLEAVKATHVLVDPMVYAEMKRVLAAWPETFHLVFDDGRWAVYEVRGTS